MCLLQSDYIRMLYPEKACDRVIVFSPVRVGNTYIDWVWGYWGGGLQYIHVFRVWPSHSHNSLRGFMLKCQSSIVFQIVTT